MFAILFLYTDVNMLKIEADVARMNHLATQ